MSEADRPRSGLSQASSTVTISSVSMGSRPLSARSVRKVHTFGKRANSIKRDPNSPVTMRGWLYKQDSSGLKLWKRRWFVLSNYCLFYYRDSREEMILGSILLPSYEIRTAFSKEKKNRRFIFKAEHPGMRTYYFSAETQLDMNSWIRAMKQAATAECDCGNYNRGLQSQSVSTCTSFEDVTLTQDDYAKSAESLEIARLSETQKGEGSSSESLHMPGSPKGSPCLRRTSLSNSLNGGYSLKRKDQPDLSSLSSQTHGSPSPVTCPKYSSRPRSPPPPPSESPSPPSPSRTPQPSPLLSIRSSRSYSLPLTPAESPQMPATLQSPTAVQRKPPRNSAPQAASCEDLSAGNSLKTLGRPNTPMGRVDIAPNEGPPNNPYAVSAPTTRGRTLTPADRYDVFPSSEEPYGRRYARSPHSSRVRLVSEEILAPSPGRPQPNRFADRAYLSPTTGTSRALVMSRFHGRLITPHSASSSYLHLPPLPPLPNRPAPGKRTSLGTTCRNPVRERSVHSAGGQRFESDTDALLTKLCGQDKLLRGLEDEMGQLRAEKERLEKALEVTRLRMEEFKGQDATMEKICYQQRQLQDELVQIRARLCDLALDSERAWEDYVALENDLQVLKGSLEHVRSVGHPQDQAAAQQDLWRIHDILAGLRSSAASCHALESRRSGVSPATSPTLDSHMGPNHSSQTPYTKAEDSEPALSPKMSPSFHEPPPSHIPATGKPGGTVDRLDTKKVDASSAGDQPQSPPAFRGAREQQASDRTRRSQHNSSCEPPETEKGKSLVRGAELIGSVHGSHVNMLVEGAEHGIVKVAPSEAPAPRRSRMSAQEQLDRMQRNQEAKRKSEGAQCSPLGHWRDSLKRGSGRVGVNPCAEGASGIKKEARDADKASAIFRAKASPPLPNSPPESSSKEGVQTGGPKPPRCPPTPEWERQRVIQLSYALAAEASQQRGKRIAGRTSSRSSLDNLSTSHDSPTLHLPKDNSSTEPETNSTTSEHSQTGAQSSSSHDNARTANLEIPSLQATTQVSCAREGSDQFLSLSGDPVLSSKPRTPQVTSHLIRPTNEELPLPNGPHWVEPLPQSANQNLPVSRTATWASTPLWDCEVWQSEQSIMGRQSLVNGRCHKWRGENKTHQVTTYLSETSRPVKVTLVKSSF